MLDKEILDATIEDRRAYERVAAHIQAREFSPHVAFWWKLVGEYYDRDKQAKCIDRAVLRQLGESKISNPKHREAILGVVSESSVSSPANVVAAVLGLLRNNRAAEFASAALGGDTAKAQVLLETINDLWKKESFDDETEEKIYAAPIEELYSKVGTGRRIPLLPAPLNVRIGGGVLPGHHIVVFGRTEIGKSCFVINLIAGFLKAGKRVLYVGNEDEINNVKARLVCRVTGKTQQEAELHQSETAAVFRKRGGEDLVRLVHMQPGSIEAIAEEVRDYKPEILVLDQIRNLSADEDGMTRKLEHNAIRFRSLLAQHNLVGVSVTQASDKSDRNSADSPVWLSAGDVDSSRVGLPAQADLMVGIGGNRDMIERGQRAISLPKNKCFSGPQSREGFITQFDLARNIVT